MTIAAAQAILTDRPFLHRTRDGDPKDGGLNRQMGDRFIAELSALERPRIAETGSGLSTLLFASLDAGSVISISPAPDLHERIRAEGAARDIDLSSVRFVDGNHGWPAVFVDFCYLNRMLRPGGLMFIDDVQVYAVAQLVCLLREQTPHYEFVSIDTKMVTFRKGLDLPYLPDWRMEPFITTNTATA